MDELEISGKRYISTRQAGKAYKYHSDYIGQLIRGKKIIGRKVGRSWYVDEASLAAYLKVAPAEKEIPAEEPVAVESVQEPAPVVQPEVEEPAVPDAPEVKEVEPVVVAVQPEVQPHEEEKIEEKIIPPVPVKEASPVSVSAFDSVHIPIRRAVAEMPAERNIGLTYIEEETPAIPEVKKLRAMHASAPRDTYLHDTMAADAAYEDAPPRRAARGVLIPMLSVVTLGLLVLVAVAASSALISSRTTVEAGKTASVGYSLR